MWSLRINVSKKEPLSRDMGLHPLSQGMLPRGNCLHSYKKWMFGEKMLRSTASSLLLKTALPQKSFTHSSSGLSRWDRNSMVLERSSMTLELPMKHLLLGSSLGAFWVHNSDFHIIQSLKSRSVARKQSPHAIGFCHSVFGMKVAKDVTETF